jgi:hypothetical protein
MFYEGGLAAPQLGRAVSTDGGHTWRKDAAPLVAGAREPGAAFDGTTWLLAFVRPGQSGAWLARSSDGVAFAPDAEPFLLPTGTEDSFERVAVASPALAWVVESSGPGSRFWTGTTSPPGPSSNSSRRTFTPSVWSASSTIHTMLNIATDS